MMEIQTNTTARRLSQLAILYQQRQSSHLMDQTLDKLLAHEAELSRSQLDALQRDLAEFERQYEMTSDEFFHRYQSGQTDDRMDFVEWASIIHMRDNLRRRVLLLTDEAAA